jgi:lipoprotein-anchoring transpeptidase ErfK/SrfK
MWVEVTVPWVDAIMDNPPPRSNYFKHSVENNIPLRFNFSQILWVDKIRVDETGAIWYRVNERYGNPGDMLWAPGEAFRPITAEELSPISPDVEDKHIVVKVRWGEQMLSCYEGNSEVYFCRVSTGKATGATPLSAVASPGFPIWRKLHSLHMSGGTNEEGWDLPGIGWTSLFHGEGVAIHSTYWHNNFGEPMSHGCVNACPEDAKWIFRWTHPVVPFETGDNDVTVTGETSTRITVVED